MPDPAPSPIQTILTTIGLPAEDIKKISGLSEEEQKTFDAKPYAEKVRSNYQTQFKNDPAFFSDLTLENLPPSVKKTLESGQYARATNVTKGLIAKSLGFTAEEIKDLEAEDFKALDHYIPAIVGKWTKTKSGDKETQGQLIEARKKLEDLNGLEEKVRTKYETESNQKISAVIFNAALTSELSQIPGLKISAADISKTASDILTAKYGFERVGDYTVELRQKANPAMKVLKDGSSKELTLKDALLEIATERGWVEKVDEKDKGGSGKVKVEPKDGVLKMVPPHLQDKISKKIADEAKA